MAQEEDLRGNEPVADRVRDDRIGKQTATALRIGETDTGDETRDPVLIDRGERE